MLLGRLMTSYQHGSEVSLLLQHTSKLTNKKPLPAHEGSALPVKPYRAVGGLCSAFSHFACIFMGDHALICRRILLFKATLATEGIFT